LARSGGPIWIPAVVSFPAGEDQARARDRDEQLGIRLLSPSLFGAVPPEGTKIIVREYTTVTFLALSVFDLIRYRREFRLFRNFGETWRVYIRRRPATAA